jgi:hypothetical protein
MQESSNFKIPSASLFCPSSMLMPCARRGIGSYDFKLTDYSLPAHIPHSRNAGNVGLDDSGKVRVFLRRYRMGGECMRNFVGVLTLGLAIGIAAGVLAAQQQPRTSPASPPPWAYGFPAPAGAPAATPAAPAAPAAQPSAPDTTMHKLAGPKS